jgi:type IV secretory pathway VirB10-like protein
MADQNIDPSILDDRNPAGIGDITPIVRVPRLNKTGLIVAAAVLLSAAIIATLTFNGRPDRSAPEPIKAPDEARPRTGWWEEIPDENPPDLQPPFAQLQPAPSPQPAVPQLPPATTPVPAVQPHDPIEDMRKQQAAQALTAQLAAGGFGAGMIETDRSKPEGIARATSPAAELAAQLKDLKSQAQGMGEADQNRQKDKEEFLKQAHRASDPDYHSELLKKPISPHYEVKAGTIIPAVLVGGMNSDLPGQVLAQVRENVRDTVTGNHVLIPQGSRLVGIYDSNVTYGQERLIVAWNRIIYPDGSSLNLKGMPGIDQSGYAGLSDEVDNHYLRIFGSAILMSAITAGIQLSQPNSGASVFGGSTFQTPSPAQVAAGALGQQMGQTALHMIQKNLNIQPTITVRNGEPFNIFVTADLLLPQNIRIQ